MIIATNHWPRVLHSRLYR